MYAIVETYDGYSPDEQTYEATCATPREAMDAVADEVAHLVREEGFIVIVQTPHFAVLSDPFDTTRLLVEYVAVAA